MTKKITALVLQGGGALGAYEYGVIKALYEQQDFSPSVVTGVSIGAINAAVLVGAKGDPVKTLGKLWQRLAVIDLPFAPRLFERALSLAGNQSMYRLRPDFVVAPLWATSVYDTTPLYRELAELVDLDKLNRSPIWVALTATNIETGALMEFENRNGRKLSFEHIVASGSLPPGFPMTGVDGGYYWDGGLVSNTPLSPAINRLEQLERDNLEAARELIVVELFPKQNKLPDNLLGVVDRTLEIVFANKLSLDRKLFNQINSYIDLVRRIDQELPENSPIRQEPAFRHLLAHRKIDKVTVIRRTAPDPVSAPTDFSKESINRRIEEGYRDAVEQLHDWTHHELYPTGRVAGDRAPSRPGGRSRNGGGAQGD